MTCHRLEMTLNYGLKRACCILPLKGSNTVALGYDEGSVTIKLGREEPPAVSGEGMSISAKCSDYKQ